MPAHATIRRRSSQAASVLGSVSIATAKKPLLESPLEHVEVALILLIVTCQLPRLSTLFRATGHPMAGGRSVLHFCEIVERLGERDREEVPCHDKLGRIHEVV